MIIPLSLVAVDVRAGMMVVCVLLLLCQQNDVVEGFGQKKMVDRNRRRASSLHSGRCKLLLRYNANLKRNRSSTYCPCRDQYVPNWYRDIYYTIFSTLY